MSASIDGLVSGLDTTALIAQLMSFERAPVTQLQARQATYDAVGKAWDDLATKIAAVRTAAEAVDTIGEASLFKATVSDSSILSASAGSTAVAGPVTLRVQSLAVAHQITSTGFASAAATVGAGTAIIAGGLASLGATAVSASADFKAGAHTLAVTRSGADLLVSLDGGASVVVNSGSPVILTGSSGTLTVTFGSTPAVGTAKVSVARTLSPTATLADLAAAISTAGGPAAAQVIDLGTGAGTDPPARFILTASQTGSAGALTVDLSGFTGLTNPSLSNLRDPGDAEIQIGTLTAKRSSNSISDLLPGVTLNLTKASPGTDVTVTVGTDTDAVVAKVKALVDALNAVRSTVTKYASYDAAKKVGGVLLSDGNVRSLSAGLASATGQQLPPGAIRTLSQLGVSTTREGTYAFDDTKLRAALGADQPAVAAALAGLTAPIATWAKDAVGLAGTATRAKAAAVAQYKDYGKQIDAYQLRLDARELRYRTQFSKMEAVLGQLRSQSSWLAGQIASLPQG